MTKGDTISWKWKKSKLQWIEKESFFTFQMQNNFDNRLSHPLLDELRPKACMFCCNFSPWTRFATFLHTFRRIVPNKVDSKQITPKRPLWSTTSQDENCIRLVEVLDLLHVAKGLVSYLRKGNASFFTKYFLVLLLTWAPFQTQPWAHTQVPSEIWRARGVPAHL